MENQDKTPKSFIERITQAPVRQWVRFSIMALLIIAFALWVGNYWTLLLLVVFVDSYITRYLPWGFWRKSKNTAFRKTMEWVDAILYALIAVYFINTFLFQNYKIPTSSLEKSLLVGDYLFVSKLSFGARVPNTPLSFPLAQHTMPILNTKSYIETPQWGYKRLKGFGEVERYDIVVFNFPAGDTVAVAAQNPDYYTHIYNAGKSNFNTDTTGMNLSNYAYNQLVKEQGAAIVKRNSERYGEVIYRPVDRRENYVKRAVGLPGELFKIVDNDVYIDGEKIARPKKMQLNYYVMTNGTMLGEQNFRDLDVSKDDRYLINNERNAAGLLAYLGFSPNEKGGYNPVYQIPLTQSALEKVKAYPFVTQVVEEPGEFGGSVFPLGHNSEWTRSNYGEIWIPKRGETLALTLDNLAIYEQAIRNYEGNTLVVKDGKIYINGKESNSYTFEMDYYMMLGDNRDKSADSRYWGFVPEDHVVGSPLLVWLSIDKDRGLFDGRIRFNRLFTGVPKE